VDVWGMPIDQRFPVYISIAEFAPSPRVVFSVVESPEWLRGDVYAIDHQHERFFLYQ